jgi:hypothetical protein
MSIKHCSNDTDSTIPEWSKTACSSSSISNRNPPRTVQESKLGFRDDIPTCIYKFLAYRVSLRSSYMNCIEGTYTFRVLHTTFCQQHYLCMCITKNTCTPIVKYLQSWGRCALNRTCFPHPPGNITANIKPRCSTKLNLANFSASITVPVRFRQTYTQRLPTSVSTYQDVECICYLH